MVHSNTAKMHKNCDSESPIVLFNFMNNGRGGPGTFAPPCTPLLVQGRNWPDITIFMAPVWCCLYQENYGT
jgi:hypothetical protein